MSVSAKREARIELRSSAAGVDQGLADARRKLKRFDRDQERGQKAAERAAKSSRDRLLSGGRSIVGGLKDGLALGLGMGAAGGLAGMATEILDYERSLTRLQITANATPTAMREFSRVVDQASRDTGINRNEILSAASAYVALTGDMDTANAATATWAKIAAATGSTVSDIAQTAAALSQQMGIGPAEMEATFAALAQQGKAGAIELKDLAGTMSQIAPMWAMFRDGRGVQGVRQLGAALQVVKRGFGGDAAETVTGLQSLLVALSKNAARFQHAGIKIFDVDKHGKETLRDVFSIVDSISKSSLVSHPDLLEKAFGRVEAYRAYLQLSQNKELLDRFVAESSDTGLIQRDFATYMESSSARIERSWNEVKLAVAAAFTPERIEAFASALSVVSDKILEVSNWLNETPEDRSANAIVDQLKTGQGDQPISNERMREIAVQLQNTDLQGDDIDQALKIPELNGALLDVTNAGMREAGERLGKEYGAISAGMRVHQDERKDDTAQYLQSHWGVRAPWLAPDPWAANPNSGQMDVNKLAAAMAQALQRTGLVVKVGAEPVARAVRNSPSLNTRPGGRE